MSITAFGCLPFAGVASAIVMQRNPLGLGWQLDLLLTLVAFSLVPLTLWLLAWLPGGGRLARERRWVAGLPFPFEGHLDVLGYFNDEVGQHAYRCVYLRVVLGAGPPSPDLIDAFREWNLPLPPPAMISLEDAPESLEPATSTLT